jgi:DNA polymerase-1
MNLLFDIETNSLDPDVCHSLVIIDVDTEELHSFADQPEYRPISEGLAMLSRAKLLVGHNIQGYDLPALAKLYGILFDAEVHDTLIMSRLIWSDIKSNDFNHARKDPSFPMKLVGSHSLKAWGHRLGNYKGDFEFSVERFAVWSLEMQEYCEQDCKLNLDFYKLIKSKQPSADSVKLEHDFAAIIRKQEQHGFHFDVVGAQKLLAVLQVRHAELNTELQTVFAPWEVKELFVPKVNNKARGYEKGVPIYKRKTVIFNPSSRDHIADRLKVLYGWAPTDFTANGKPKVDETVLSSLEYPEAKLLTEYLLIDKRIGQLATGQNAWLKLEKNGRIHGQVNTNGASTGRCTHNRPNIAQVPSVGSPYGAECRALFHAPSGYALVGADLSGLELRCLAHYMAPYDAGEYSDVVVNGDIHTKNQLAAGLPSRSTAKVFIYGFLYGAGPAKIGSIVDGSEKEGRALIARFMKQTPAIKLLRDAVAATVKKNGTLRGLDGRVLPVRSDHAALNTLLQSAGAVLSKKATVFLSEILTTKGYISGVDYVQVAHVHDEVQLIARKEIADEVGRAAVKSFQLAGEYFDFKCPITGEFKVGNNWADTH